ncbi:MAG TPA: alanine racemase [Solirubrobacteraceae bacterium]|nr:alanine racemase [Solirubrobacteraceae bacterium]
MNRSPIWVADVERFSSNVHAFTDAWQSEWPRTRVAYSYKTNRLVDFLHAAELAGASAEVVCESEYELAIAVVETDPRQIVVDGPAKPDALLARAGAGGALVLADSVQELDRVAAAGVEHVGLRVALESFTGGVTRFGIAPREICAAADAAAALGLSVEALSTHLVSTDFDPATGRVVVNWPRPAAEHARAAARLAELVRALKAGGHPVATIDLGGGFPPAPAVADHARAVATALRAGGFDGTLLLEPGRAVVADAVDLVFTVVAVKTLADGSRCLVCDAGTNFLPGALTLPPRIEALDAHGPLSPAVVTGPLCLNVDVINPGAPLPALKPGARLVARSVGAYQQSAATGFGEAPPPVTVRNRAAQPVTV